MEILRTEYLTKIYGKGDNQVIAVNDVSFSVEQGEFVAIVGSSGSGKSTLLHLLGGVDRPTSGKVFVQGEDVYQMNSDQLAIFRRRQHPAQAVSGVLRDHRRWAGPDSGPLRTVAAEAEKTSTPPGPGAGSLSGRSHSGHGPVLFGG